MMVTAYMLVIVIGSLNTLYDGSRHIYERIWPSCACETHPVIGKVRLLWTFGYGADATRTYF